MQVVVFVVSFLVALALGMVMIPFLRRMGVGQTVRNDGPSTHLKKTGTPTMGGIIIIIPVIIVSLRFSGLFPGTIPLVLATAGFMLTGFLDDLLKTVRKSKDGLTARQKMLALLSVSAAFSIYAAYYSPMKTAIIVPFTGMGSLVTLPVWVFIPFTMFVLVSSTNAVNLTDGVDGLAASVTIVVMVFFAIASMAWDDLSHIMVFSTACAGGCLGFLAFNLHPAKIFMGDTGSLALGGAVAAASVLMGVPWVLLIAGFVYVAEAVSVIIQVAHFKMTGKRLFRMSPLHHHFELSGWKENRIVAVFTGITVLLCIIGLILL